MFHSFHHYIALAEFEVVIPAAAWLRSDCASHAINIFHTHNMWVYQPNVQIAI